MCESQWKGLWERDGVVVMEQAGGFGEAVLGGCAWAPWAGQAVVCCQG